MRILDENSPEKHAKLSAIKSLINHIDQAMSDERGQMKSMKLKASIEEDPMATEAMEAIDGMEECGEPTHEIDMDAEPSDEYESISPNLGSGAEQNSTEFSNEMKERFQDKYKARNRPSGNKEKTKLFVVDKKMPSEPSTSAFDKFKLRKKK